MTERIGEIIATNSFAFVAQSFTLNHPPALGSLVKVQTGPDAFAYGVVTYGETAAVDPGRQPIRRSQPDIHDEAVYARHPELQHVLRTVFTAVLVGHTQGDKTTQRLPAYPPSMHFSVQECENAEALAFTEKLAYIRTLADAQAETPVDQVLAANLRWTYEARGGDADWLDRAALEVAALFQQDVEKLLAVLHAVDPEA